MLQQKWCRSSIVYVKRVAFSPAATQPIKSLTGSDRLSLVHTETHALNYFSRESYRYCSWTKPFHPLNLQYHKQWYRLPQLSTHWRCYIEHETPHQVDFLNGLIFPSPTLYRLVVRWTNLAPATARRLCFRLMYLCKHLMQIYLVLYFSRRRLRIQ